MVLLASIGFVESVLGQATRPPDDAVVNFAKTNGVIRPLHGVNSGPLCYRGTVDLSAYHRDLGIPLTRLHDVPWVNAEAVDIHTIFPDFRDDPERPENYRFGPTDEYIQAITNVPSQIVYRLGESIEHTARQYFVHPPADPDRWASICLGIIRHYNEGWAGGFRHRIGYWEIWNEPDVRPAMWTGSDAEFFRLYGTAAKAIKKRFPEVKVGGPAVGGTGDFVAGAFHPAPFLTNFLAYCRLHQVPLDFFSWHRYTSQPWDLPRRAKAIRLLLDSYGFSKTESHLNEWNYLPDDNWNPLVRQGQGRPREQWFARMGGREGAAFVTAALMLFQDAPLDAANFYTGEIQGFGLFTLEGIPKSTYYAFKAFRELLSTPVRVETRAQIEGLTFVAGLDEERTRATVLLSNVSASQKEFTLLLTDLPWQSPTHYEVFRLSDPPQLDLVETGTRVPATASLSLRLEAPGVALVKLSRRGDR